MKNAAIEPKLTSIFRVFLVIQLALIGFNVLAHMHLGLLSGCPVCVIAVAAAGIFLLLGYLSWHRLAVRLGRFYLPLALGLSVFLSAVIQSELIQSFIAPQEFSGDESAWQIFLFLFFPLVLVAWQYNFRAVVLYSLFCIGLESLVLHFGSYTWFHEIFYPRSILIRTVVFLAAGYVISLIMRQQRQQRQSLLEANQSLRHYAATLEQLAVTQERNRMSRELHDTLAHTLSGLAVQLEAARSLWKSAPERSYALLEDSLQGTRSGLTETRKAIQALRAGPLEELGLPLALRDLAESAASRAGAALSLALPERLEKLAPDVEQCVFRVAQESLENIVRHAEAQHITVQLAREGPRLVLTIGDDGRGFEPAQAEAQDKFGLRGLRERVALFAGDLQILSCVGQGTTVCLVVKAGS